MTIRASTLAAIAILTTIGSATAGERTDITPPLYREYARPTAAVRPAAVMTTTPSLVRTATEAPRRIIEATAR